MKILYVIPALLFTMTVNADNSTIDAAIGGGLGGAAGAAIGNEIGGRDGAIIGGALGGAVGTAVTTDKEPKQKKRYYREREPERYYRERERYYYEDHYRHSSSRFCPPGQAKKGRC